MSEEIESTILEEATDSLVRIQNFDVSELPQVGELGAALNFNGAVEPAKRLISLYKRLSKTALEDFPDSSLKQISAQCDADYQKLNQILKFQITDHQTPSAVRDSYINAIVASYDPAFIKLSPFISYSLHRSADFQRLDTDARSTLQKITDESAKIKTDLEKQNIEAEQILKDIRETAAEQGVTQQAIYFQNETTSHETEAVKWESRTVKVASVLGLVAVGSFFLHKWSWLAPSNTYETIQLVSSKLIIFAVLTYLLILSAKNYLNHKHNSIVNKHRQNALMTYKAMVDATDDPGSREAILIQAAGCIFNSQSTGYTSTNESPSVSGRSMVEILSKPVVQAASNASKT